MPSKPKGQQRPPDVRIDLDTISLGFTWIAAGGIGEVVIAKSPFMPIQLAITATRIVPQVVSRMFAIGYAGV